MPLNNAGGSPIGSSPRCLSSTSVSAVGPANTPELRESLAYTLLTFLRVP